MRQRLFPLGAALVGLAAGCASGPTAEERIAELEAQVKTLSSAQPYVDSETHRARIAAETRASIAAYDSGINTRLNAMEARVQNNEGYTSSSVRQLEGTVTRGGRDIAAETAKNDALRRRLETTINDLQGILTNFPDLQRNLRDVRDRFANGERASEDAQRQLDTYLRVTRAARQEMIQYYKRTDVTDEQRLAYITNTYRPALQRALDDYRAPRSAPATGGNQ